MRVNKLLFKKKTMHNTFFVVCIFRIVSCQNKACVDTNIWYWLGQGGTRTGLSQTDLISAAAVKMNVDNQCKCVQLLNPTGAYEDCADCSDSFKALSVVCEFDNPSLSPTGMKSD
jgi:hypothetical protein